ncbi:MAG: ribulose-phosphate 3-epimerase [Anaerolineae bacterium]|nr:ribulose-phosphate 3-epimerase [Anaerolineae bacterium]
MLPRVELAASIMCADFRRLGDQVRELDAAGMDRYHFDVIDGHFSPNFALSQTIVSALRGDSDKLFEAHLMVTEPERFIDEFAKAGCGLIYVHQEVTIHLRRLVKQIRDAGCRAGVALNPVTPIEPLMHVLGDISDVILMTVDAGFAAQPFAPTVIPKIAALRAMINRERVNVHIEVDGGINPRTIDQVVGAGADVLVLGSTGLFNESDLTAGAAKLREQAQRAAHSAYGQRA